MDKFRLTECQTLDIPVGNDVPLLVKLVKGFDGCDGESAVPFPIDVCENVAVTMVSERGQVKSVAHRLGTDGEVLLELQAGDFRAGLTYGIDVRATLNGKAVHAYGKSLVRITAATERGPRQVAQAADPYEVTLQVGYVGDVIPRRLDELEGYDDLMAEVDGKADADKVGEALEAVGREFQKYIPLAHKAAAGGVASLNGEKKVPTDQLQFPLRGQLTPSQIDSTTLADGVYQVNGKVLSPDILGGAQANGVLVQYPWDSRVQTLFVGRAAAHADGEQVETYTRRYLPTPKRWTAWSKAAGGGGSDDVLIAHVIESVGFCTSTTTFQQIVEARAANKPICVILHKSLSEPIGSTGTILFLTNIHTQSSAQFSSIPFLENGLYKVRIITWAYEDIISTLKLTIYDSMLPAEARGEVINDDAKTIQPSMLKYAIDYHTRDLVNGGAYNSTTKKIELKHGSTVVAEIDATPFIIDGMVEDVRIENGNLVIDFNTASGKQDIEIPLTEIFNPSNYYDKTEADEKFQPKGNYLTEHQDISGKQDVQHTAVYTADSTVEDFHPMELGSLQEGENSWTLYKFFFKVGNLPNNTSLVVSLAQLLANYTIGNVVSVHGVTSSGHFVSSGRTDDLSKVCVAQQGSRLRKEITLRTYADLSSDSATLLIEFYGTKDA